MSPNQPLSVNPRSVSSQQPATPNVETKDIKPTLPILMSAITSSNDHQQNKNSISSPRPSTSNADPLQNSSNLENKKSPGDKSNKNDDALSSASATFSSKRPILNTRDYEIVNADDYAAYQLLYDYSTWDAW